MLDRIPEIDWSNPITEHSQSEQGIRKMKQQIQ
jgi:hypothetical protein